MTEKAAGNSALLQVWREVVIIGCSSLSAAISADGIQIPNLHKALFVSGHARNNAIQVSQRNEREQ